MKQLEDIDELTTILINKFGKKAQCYQCCEELSELQNNKNRALKLEINIKNHIVNESVLFSSKETKEILTKIIKLVVYFNKKCYQLIAFFILQLCLVLFQL